MMATTGIRLAAAFLAAAGMACGAAEPRGGAATLPGPVPSGVSFTAANPSAPPAPDFSLRLLDGTEVSGTDLWAERPVVLTFFASWCGPCAEQQADWTALAERYGDAVVFLGVAGADEQAAVERYLEEHEVPYPVALDAELDVWRSYAVMEPPLVALVARGGRLAHGWPGGTDGPTLRAALGGLVTLPPGG